MTLPSGTLRKTGESVGTMPSARAFASSTVGAESAATCSRSTAWASVSLVASCCRSPIRKAPCAIDVLMSRFVRKPPARRAMTMSTKTPRLARSARGGATTRSAGSCPLRARAPLVAYSVDELLGSGRRSSSAVTLMLPPPGVLLPSRGPMQTGDSRRARLRLAAPPPL